MSKKVKAYTRAKRTACTLYTIEFIAKDALLMDDDCEALKYALDSLRSVGGAAVVKIEPLVDEFDAACDILDSREAS